MQSHEACTAISKPFSLQQASLQRNRAWTKLLNEKWVLQIADTTFFGPLPIFRCSHAHGIDIVFDGSLRQHALEE